MPTASLDNVTKRVIALLNANPDAFTNTVSGEVGAFPGDEEINLAILEADEFVVTKGYFQSINQSLSEPFKEKIDLENGEEIPFHYGKSGTVELSNDEGETWAKGVEALHVDDITNAIAVADVIGDDAFAHLYKLSNNNFYTPADVGRIEIQIYTRTAELQANEAEEFLLIATAVRFLTKHASPAAFDVYAKESFAGVQQLITDGNYQPSASMEE